MEWGFTLAGTWISGVDVIVLIFCILGGVSGAITSFSRILGKRAGSVLGILFAIMFSRALSVHIIQAFSLSLFLSVLIAYAVLFTVTYIVASVLGGVLGNILDAIGLDIVDRILGFAAGLLEALIFCILILHLLEIQRLIPLQEYILPSFFYNYLTLPVLSVIF